VKRDRWQDAYTLFERASSRDAGHLDARNNTAWALGRLGRWQEALAILDELVIVRPDWKLVHTNRAWVLRGLGRVEEAVAEDARADGTAGD
jgi:tetratricopeptide (TPR) repeat protein